MRHFHWKTAIVSVIIFALPIFFYPVSGTMTDGVTTYSYGFPSKWLSLHFQNQGGRLFGFQVFQAKNVSVDVSFLTCLLDLLIIYLILTAFVKVFWINHFSIKFFNWRARRYYKKHGITPPVEEAVVNDTVSMEYIVNASETFDESNQQNTIDQFDINGEDQDKLSKDHAYYYEDFHHEHKKQAETDKTA